MKHMQKQAFAHAIEHKGEDNDPVELVNKSLETFEQKVTERIDSIEEQADTTELAGRLEKLEAKANRPGGGGGTTTDEQGEIEEKALDTFLRSGAFALDEDGKKALNLGTPAEGGYAVAPEYSSRIIEEITEFSPMRAVASVTGIGTTEIFYPKMTAALNGTWVTETGERQESEPTWDQIKIGVHEHAVIVPISRQLLEDNYLNLQSYLSGQIGRQFGKAEATAFVTGDGNGKPTGFMDAPGDFTSIEAALDESDLIEKLIETYYALPTAYAQRGTWMMNRQMIGKIRKAADSIDRGTLWSDSLAEGQPPRFLGAPVREAVDMADFAAEAHPVAFGDWSTAYQIVDRVGVQLMRDDYTGADNGIVKIRARRRVGGKTVQPEAIVLLEVAAT